MRGHPCAGGLSDNTRESLVAAMEPRKKSLTLGDRAGGGRGGGRDDNGENKI